MVIWKFAVPVERSFKVEMPKDAEVLSVQVQHGAPCMWAMCDPNAKKEERIFHVIGTGHEVGDRPITKFIGTFQLEGGAFIGHLFEGAGDQS
jgi:hypothetical protein